MKTAALKCPLPVAKGLKVALLGACALVGNSLCAKAAVTPLPPNAFVTSPTANAFLGGTLFATQTGTFVTSDISGSYTEYVFQEVGGTYDFYLQFSVNPGVTGDGIRALSLTNFSQPGPGTTWTIDAFYNTDGLAGSGLSVATGTVAPTNFSRSALVGSTIGMDYTPPTGKVLEGMTSYWVGFKTNATSVGTGGISLQDGGNSGVLSFLVPVPEPTAAIFGFALVGVVAVARTRRSLSSRREELSA